VTWKIALARTLWHLDRAADRLRPGPPPGAGVIEPYLGYATPDALVARGRVLVTLKGRVPKPGQSRLRNAAHVAARFFTREVAGARVVAEDGTEAVADDEGYVTLRLPRPADAAGWVQVRAGLPGQPDSGVEMAVAVPSVDADLGIISDIDDTLMRTGAYSLLRNLWTTLTGNSLTREVFPDAVAFLARLHAGRNPVFYVSSSPWNLHDFLEQVFARAGLVRGPIFLRDLGIGRNRVGGSGHGVHKGAAIDAILAANPGLDFVLVGDTGQHDAEIYAAAVGRHPGRVRRIVLRQAGRRGRDPDLFFARAAAARGVDVSVGADFTDLRRI
jgi:phosphatidate phosphatase APP1